MPKEIKETMVPRPVPTQVESTEPIAPAPIDLPGASPAGPTVVIQNSPAPQPQRAPEPIEAPEPTISVPTMKNQFVAGGIAAGIVLGVLLVIWLTFKIIPAIFSGGASFVATTLNSTFIPAETSSEPAKKDPADTSPSKNTNGTVSTVSAVQNYYGNPDLEISLIGTGIIDPASKQFVLTNYAGANNEIAVKFQVRNTGTNVSGPWTLRLNMPSRTTPYYDSNQPSIKPGDRIEYVGSFNTPANVGMNTGYVLADPLNSVSESSETNNNLTVQFNVSGTSYNYNNNYNYGTNYNYNNTYPYYNYGQLYTWTNINVTCYANPQTAMRGTPITWYATASGGNGYFTYYWNGDDNLYSTTNAVGHVYYTQGNKYATVSVTSGGQTVTRQCSTTIY